jgi:hypothetical protein
MKPFIILGITVLILPYLMTPIHSQTDILNPVLEIPCPAEDRMTIPPISDMTLQLRFVINSELQQELTDRDVSVTIEGIDASNADFSRPLIVNNVLTQFRGLRPYYFPLDSPLDLGNYELKIQRADLCSITSPFTVTKLNECALTYVRFSDPNLSLLSLYTSPRLNIEIQSLSAFRNAKAQWVINDVQVPGGLFELSSSNPDDSTLYSTFPIPQEYQVQSTSQKIALLFNFYVTNDCSEQVKFTLSPSPTISAFVNGVSSIYDTKTTMVTFSVSSDIAWIAFVASIEAVSSDPCSNVETGSGDFTVTCVINRIFSGTQQVAIQYLDVLTEFSTTITPKYPTMTPLASQSDVNTIKLGWTLPTDRWIQYQNRGVPNSYAKFTLHTRTAGGIEGGPELVVLNGLFDPSNGYPLTCNVLINRVQYNGLVMVPDTVEEVTLNIPLLDPNVFDSNGYVIVMSEVTGSGFPSENVNVQLAWSFQSYQPVPACSFNECPNGYQCSLYTGKCYNPAPIQPSTWTTSPLINSDNECQLQCPKHFTQSSDCTQCTCTTPICLTHTRSYQLFSSNSASWYKSSAYISQRGTILQRFVVNHFYSILGIAQLPYRDPNGVWDGNIPYSGLPSKDQTVPNLREEDIFIQFMNPTNENYFADTFILTISMNSVGYNDSSDVMYNISSRFRHIEERLKALLGPINLASPFLPTSFILDNKLAVVSYGNPNDRVKCRTSDGKIGNCPQMTTAMLTFSPFWSPCQNNQHVITPYCIGYDGASIESSVQTATNWCQRGYIGFPSMVSIPCSPTNTAKLPESPLNWSPPTTRQIVHAGDSILITWVWPTDQIYNPLYTIDIIYQTSSNSVPVILSTALASRNQALVTIPIPTDPILEFNEAFLLLRCTHVFKYRTPESNQWPLHVKPNLLCNNVDCGGNDMKCSPSSGECICHDGFEFDSTSGRCKLPCDGLCPQGICTIDQPDTCTNCTNGLLPPYCTTPTNCNNDQTTGLHSQCNNRGFIPFSSNNNNNSNNNNGCGSSCECLKHLFWTGEKCNSCLITDGIDSALQCDKLHTNLVKTRDNCQSCLCLPGSTGEKCNIKRLRVDVTYTEENPTTPLQDSNGVDSIPNDVRSALIHDMMLSFGLPIELIDLIGITNVSQSTSSSPFQLLKSNLTPQQSTPTRTTIITYSISTYNDQDMSMGFDSLSGMWDDLTKDDHYKSLPLSDVHQSFGLGSVSNVGTSQAPEENPPCDPKTENCECTDAERLSNGGVCPKKESGSSNTGIIIGVVVAVVIVVGVFIVTIVLVKYAKKNEKWCFSQPKRRQAQSNKQLELTISNDGSIGSHTPTFTKTNNSSKQTQSVTNSSAVDLIEIKDHGEKLPLGWTKHKHAVTGESLYINQEEMRSQKHSPLVAEGPSNGW